MTHELWSALNRKMVDFLDSVSVQDLVDQQRMRQLADANKQSVGVMVNTIGHAEPAANAVSTSNPNTKKRIAQAIA